MKIAIIGAGSVGSALGTAWARKGHEVVFGVRDPASGKVRTVIEAAPGSSAATVEEAAKNAEAVVFATPWPATQNAVASAGNLAGKVVIDCTNPLKPDLSGLDLGHTTSAAEKVAEWASGARVVKAFNTTGANNMENPEYDGQQAAMFYCGDDAEAKKAVERLIKDVGFDPVDAGPLANARLLEPAAMLWIWLAYAGGEGRDFAFKLLRR